MTPAPLVLAIDQGTSGSKALLVDARGEIVARGSASLGQQHPQPGWVEQDPEALWQSVRAAVGQALALQPDAQVVGIGLSTQRESVLLWERASGLPLGPLLSWQDQRTAAACHALRTPATARLIRERSGLPLDPMFSAIKARWLLDTHDPTRRRASAGELCLGTVDSWLLYRLTGAHLGEVGNASRTQLLNLATLDWDEDLLALFGVPRAILPRLCPSNGPYPPLQSGALPGVPGGTPIHAALGDSHAALFAHGAFTPGTIKATYGTGSSVMGLLAGRESLDPGLCLTVAWSVDGRAQYAAEGNVRSAGSTLTWLAEVLGTTPGGLATLAAGLDDSPVTIVPAFGGLGAPWWDEQAVGVISNLTLASSRADLAYAALDAVGQQVADVVEAVGRSGSPVQALYADGGATVNEQLMQLQADLIGRPVVRARQTELSALGAAHLAGLGAGVWDWAALAALPRARDPFRPRWDAVTAAGRRQRWQTALARARQTAPASEPAHPVT